jgi:hypothetical protein
VTMLTGVAGSFGVQPHLPSKKPSAVIFTLSARSLDDVREAMERGPDAREIQSADPLEADLNSSPSTTTGMASTEPRHRRRR